MSGQRSKKVRMGSSRRRTSNQKEKSDPDDGILKTQSLSTVEHSVAEESNEAVADFAEPNYSQAANQAVADVTTGNRRKLGSSRKIKDRKDVKDSTVKSHTSQHSETREEVYDNTPSKEELLHKSRNSIPSIPEMESASYQEHDFIQQPDNYKQLSCNLREEIGPENKGNDEQSGTLCSNEMDTGTLPPECQLNPQDNILSKQREPFRGETREASKDNTLERREIMQDEETTRDESKRKMSTVTIADTRLGEMSQVSEHDSSAFSSNVPEDSFLLGTPTTTSSTDECLIPKSEAALDVDGNNDDNKLKGMTPSIQFQSEEVSDHVKTYSSAKVVGQLHQPDDANDMHDQVTTHIKEMEQLVKSDDQPVISDPDNTQDDDATTKANDGLLYQGHETVSGEETSEPEESVDLKDHGNIQSHNINSSQKDANDPITQTNTYEVEETVDNLMTKNIEMRVKGDMKEMDFQAPEKDGCGQHLGDSAENHKFKETNTSQLTDAIKNEIAISVTLDPSQNASLKTAEHVSDSDSLASESDASNASTLIGSDSQSHDVDTSRNEPMDTSVEVEPLDNTNDEDVEKSLISGERHSDETKHDKSETDDMDLDSTLSTTLLGEQDEDVTETTFTVKREVEDILEVIEETNALQSENTPLITSCRPNEIKESFASQYHQAVDASDQFDIHVQDNTESLKVLTGAVDGASYSEDVGTNALPDQDSTVMASTSENVREQPEEENLGHGRDEKQIDVDIAEVAKNVGDAIMVEATPPTENQLQFDVECKHDNSEEQRQKPCEAVMDSSHLSDTNSHELDYDKDSPDTAEHVSEYSLPSKSDVSDAHEDHQGILDHQDKDQTDENPHIKSTGKRRKMGSTRRLHPKKAISDKGATMEFDTTDVNMRNQKSFEGELNVISETKDHTSHNTGNMDLTLIGSDSQSHDINTSHNEPMDTPVEVEPLDSTNDDVEKSMISGVRDIEETKDAKTDDVNMDPTFRNLGGQDEDVPETTFTVKKEVEDILEVIEETNALQSENTPFASDQFDIHVQDNTESLKVLTGAVDGASYSEDVGTNALPDQDSTVMASTSENVREQPEEENLGHGRDEKQIDVDIAEVAKNVGDTIMVEATPPTENQLQFDVECKYDNSEEQRQKPCEAVMDSSHLSDTNSHELDYDKDSPDTAEHVSEYSLPSKSDVSDAHEDHQGILDHQDKDQTDENPHIKSTGKRRKMGSTRRLHPKKAISDKGATMEFDTTDVNMRNQKSFEGELNVISETKDHTSHNTGNMDLTLIGSDSQSHDINTSHNEPMDTPVEVEPLDSTNDDVEKSMISGVRDIEETKDSKTDDVNMDPTFRNLGGQDEDVPETTFTVKKEVEDILEVIEETKALQSENTPFASDQFDIHVQDNTESLKVLTGAVDGASYSEDVGTNALPDQDSTVMASTSENVREQPEEENLGHGRDEKQIDVDIAEVAKNVGDAIMVEATPPTENQLQFDVECKYDNSEEQRQKPCEAVMQSSHLSDTNSHELDYDKDSPDTAEHVSEYSLPSKSDVADAHEDHQGMLDHQDKNQTDENPHIKSTGKRRKMGSTRRLHPKKAISDKGATMEFDTTDVNMRNQKSFEGELNVISETKDHTSTGNMDLTLIGSDSQSHDINTSHNEPMDTHVEVEPLDSTNDDVEKSMISGVRDIEETKDAKTDDVNMDPTFRNLGGQDEDVPETTFTVKREVEDILEVIEETNALQSENTPFASDQFDIHVQDNTESLKVLTGAVDGASYSEDVGTNALPDQDSTVMASTSENVREQPEEENLGHGRDEKQIDVDIAEVAKNVGDAIMVEATPPTENQLQFDVECKYDNSEEQRQKPCEAVMDSSHLSDTNSHELDYDKDSPDTAEHVSEYSLPSKSDVADAHEDHQGMLDHQDKNQTDENPHIKSTGKRRKMGSTRRLHPKKAISDKAATMEFDTTDVNMRNQKSFEGELNVISETKDHTSHNTGNMDLTLIGSDSQSHDINTSHNEPMDTPVEVEPLDSTNDDVEKSMISGVRDIEETKDAKTDNVNMDPTFRNLGGQDEDVPETTFTVKREVEDILEVIEETNALQSENTPFASDQFDIHVQDNTESLKVLTGAVDGASYSEDVGTNALPDQDSSVMASTSENVREQPEEENLGHGRDEKQIDVDIAEVAKNVGYAIMVEATPPTENQLQFDVECKYDNSEEQRQKPCEAVMDSSHLSDTNSHELDNDKDSPDTAEHVSEYSLPSKSDVSDAHEDHQGMLDHQDKDQTDENPHIKSTGKRRKMGSTRRLHPKKAISDKGATMEFDTTDVNMRNQKSFEGELNVISETKDHTSHNTGNMDLTLIGSDSQSHDINTSHNEPMDTPVEVEPLDSTNDDVEKSMISGVRDIEETKDAKTDNVNMDPTFRNLGGQDEDVPETTFTVKREVEDILEVIEETNALQSENTPFASDQFDIHVQDNTESLKVLTGAVDGASYSEDVGTNALPDQDSSVMASTSENVREQPEEENLGHGRDEKQIDVDIAEVAKNVGYAIMVEATPPTENQLQFDVECKYDNSEEQRQKPCEAVMDSSHLSDTNSHELDNDKDSPDTAEHVSEYSLPSKSDVSDAHEDHQGMLDHQDKDQTDENPHIKSTGKRRKMGSTRRLHPKKAISDKGATMEFDTTDVNMRNQKSFGGELNVISETKDHTSHNTGNMDLTLIGSDSQSHDINTSHNEPMDTPVEVEPLDSTNDFEKSMISGVRDIEETKDAKTDDVNMDPTFRNLGGQDEDVPETTFTVKREVEDILKVIEETNALQSENTPFASDQFDIHVQDNTESLKVLTGAVDGASYSEDVGTNALPDQDSTVMASTSENDREQPEEENLGHGRDEKQIDVDIAEVAKNVGDTIMVEATPPTENQLQFDVECKYDNSEEQRQKPCEAVMDSSHLSDTNSHELDYDKDSPDTAEHVSEYSLPSKSDVSDAHEDHQGMLDHQDKNQTDENPHIKSTGKRRKMGSTRRLHPKKAISDKGATMEFDTTDVNMRNQKSFEGELNVISETKDYTSHNTGNMDLTLIGSDSQSHDINTSHNEPMDTPVEVEPLDSTNDDVEKSMISGVRDIEETKDAKTDDINMDPTFRNFGEQDEDVPETTFTVKREVEDILEVIEETKALQSENTPFMTLCRPNSEIKESLASQYHQAVDASDHFDIHVQDNTESMKVLTGAVDGASYSEDVGTNALPDQDSSVMASTSVNVGEQPEEENLGHGRDEKQIDVDIAEVAKNVGDTIMVEATPPTENQLQFDVECKYDNSEEQRQKPCEAVMDSSHLSDTNSHELDYDKDSPDTAEHVSEHSMPLKSDASDAHRDHQAMLDHQDKKQTDDNPHMKSTGKRRKMGSTRRLQPKKAISDQGAIMEFDTTAVDASDQFDIHVQGNTESLKVLTGGVDGTSYSEDVGNNALLDQDSTVMASTSENVREQPEEENLGHGRDEKQIDVDIAEVAKNVGDAIMVEATPPTENQLQFDVECKYDNSEEQRQKPCEAVMDSSHLSDTNSHELDYDKDSPDTAEHVSEYSLPSKSDVADAHEDHQGMLDHQDKNQTDENPHIKSTGKRRKMGSTRRLQPKKAISDQGATMEFDTTDVNMRNQKSFEGELNVITEMTYNTSNNTGNMDLALIGSDSQSHDINTSHNEPIDTLLEPLDSTNDDVEKSMISGVRDIEETKDYKTDDINMDLTEEENLGHGRDEKQIDVDIAEVAKNVGDAIMVEATPPTENQLQFDVECKYDNSEEQRQKPCEAVMDSSHLSDTNSHELDYDKDSPDTAEHVSETECSLPSKSDASDRDHQAMLDQQEKKQTDENPHMKSTGKRRKMGSTRRLQPKKAISDQGATMEFDTTDVNMRNQKSFVGEREQREEENLGHGRYEKQVDVDIAEVAQNVGDAITVEATPPTENQLKFDVECKYDNSEEQRQKPCEAVMDSSHLSDTNSHELAKDSPPDTDTDIDHQGILDQQEKKQNDENPQIISTGKRRKMGSSRKLQHKKAMSDQGATMEFGNMDVTLIGSDSQTHDMNMSYNKPIDTSVEAEPLDSPNDDVEKSSTNRVRNSEGMKLDTLRNLLGEQDEDVTETTVRVKRDVGERLGVINEADVSQSENHDFKESNTEDSGDTHRRRKMGSSRRNTRFAHKKDKTSEDVIAELSAQKEVIGASQGRDENALVDPEKQKQLQIGVECKYGESEEQRETSCEAVDSSHLSDTHFTPIQPAPHLGSEENPVSDGELIGREHQLSPSYTSSNSSSSTLNASAFEIKRRKMGSNRRSRGQQQGRGEVERADEVLSSCDENVERFSSSSNRGHSSQEASDHQRDLKPRYDVAIVGNSYVGKTSFIKRIQNGRFTPDFCATIGIDTCKHSVTVDGKTVGLELWDTAGQERFRSITRQMFHKAQAFLLMYDITSSQSFCDVAYWISCIQEGATEDVIIMLLGNKNDCAERKVQSHEGKALAQEYNIEFLECSAATGENVTQSMETIARMLSKKHATKEEVVLRKEPPKKKSGCC